MTTNIIPEPRERVLHLAARVAENAASASLQATLVIVCYACCGDPALTPQCPRCSGTGADPNPGRAA